MTLRSAARTSAQSSDPNRSGNARLTCRTSAGARFGVALVIAASGWSLGLSTLSSLLRYPSVGLPSTAPPKPVEMTLIERAALAPQPTGAPDTPQPTHRAIGLADRESITEPIVKSKLSAGSIGKPGISLASRAKPMPRSIPSANRRMVPNQPDSTTSQPFLGSQPVPASDHFDSVDSSNRTNGGAGENTGSNTRDSTGQGGNHAAEAVEHPEPVLPDELREEAYSATAIARFTIHADGSVAIVLLKPAANPRLNSVLLRTLRAWRFKPAQRGGQPIESQQDIEVHFTVH